VTFAPSYLTLNRDSDLDDRINENRRRREKDYPEAWGGPNSWVSRFEIGSFLVAPTIARIVESRSARVLEIGCGQGQKALSYAPFVGSLLGVDINGDLISFAKTARSRMNSPNTEFETCEANDIKRILTNDEFDIVVLYAVIEHLTPNERLDLLATIWGNLKESGLILIGETPNRISSFDMHTSNLPFVDALNDEYYLKYVETFSPRKDWQTHMSAYQNRWLGSYRAGRGVSFHEFDLLLGKQGDIGAHITWDSFSSLARIAYPLRSSELGILEETRWQGNRIDQSFCRYWIEAVIAKKLNDSARTHREFSLLRPRSERGLAMGFDECGLRAYGLRGRWQSLKFDLPGGAHAFQLIVDVDASEGDFEVRDQRGKTMEEFSVSTLRAANYPGQRYVVLDRIAPQGTTSITLRPTRSKSWIVTGGMGVFGAGSLGPLDRRTPRILGKNF
jgi:S-adenosylmethionine-dependent methyltransferase